jgi:hypothetical protein
MISFTASPPNVCSPAVAPLRTSDPVQLLAAINGIKPPYAPDVEAELLAIGFVHEDDKVRKRAMTLATKHVPDAPKFKAAYKSLAGVGQHVVDERLRAFAHPYRLDISRAMMFHRKVGGVVAFEEDAASRAVMLDVMAERAKREDENELKLGEIYWYWQNQSGRSMNLQLHVLPPGLFGEIAKRREVHPFEGLSLHGGELNDLPAEIAGLKPWLKSLSLAWNPFTTLPDVLWELENLESLELLGTKLFDIPPDIARLTKLRSLDIGNMKNMKEIPASVCALDKLESLRIGNGSIRKVPAAIVNMTSLRELELQSTSVSSLPAGMASMPNLKQVNLRWSKVDAQTVATLVAAGIQVVR